MRAELTPAGSAELSASAPCRPGPVGVRHADERTPRRRPAARARSRAVLIASRRGLACAISSTYCRPSTSSISTSSPIRFSNPRVSSSCVSRVSTHQTSRARRTFGTTIRSSASRARVDHLGPALGASSSTRRHRPSTQARARLPLRDLAGRPQRDAGGGCPTAAPRAGSACRAGWRSTVSSWTGPSPPPGRTSSGLSTRPDGSGVRLADVADRTTLTVPLGLALDRLCRPRARHARRRRDTHFAGHPTREATAGDDHLDPGHHPRRPAGRRRERRRHHRERTRHLATPSPPSSSSTGTGSSPRSVSTTPPHRPQRPGGDETSRGRGRADRPVVGDTRARRGLTG
jgi:hypothetical protein